MAEITITVPDGLDQAQMSNLTAWLRRQVAEAVPADFACEHDAEWQEATAREIRQGRADVEAERVMSSLEARWKLDHHLGVTRQPA